MIGICTRYQRHEATYAAIRLADWYEHRGEEVSIFTFTENPAQVSRKWDKRVVTEKMFSDWSTECETVVWTNIPHTEQLQWVNDNLVNSVLFLLWHELSPVDRYTLPFFDHVLCPLAAPYKFLRNQGLRNCYNVGWDCGVPATRKPTNYVIDGLQVFVPLWDGNARRTEMTLLDVIDRCLVRESTCQFTIAYSSSTITSAAKRRLFGLRRTYPARVILRSSVHPDDRPLLFAQHDLTLWASHFESMCTTAHLSYAAGTPVLGFNYSPADECLDDKIAIPVPVEQVQYNDIGLPYAVPNYQLLDEFLLHAVEDTEYIRYLQQNIAMFTEEPRDLFHGRLTRTLCERHAV